MTRNAYLIIGLVLLLIIVGFILLRQGGENEALAPTGEEISINQGIEEAATSTETSIVTYTDSGFSPVSVTIKAGDTVIFKNNSGRDFWPASAIHPTHELYPEFDAKKAIPAGSTYSFIFTRTGSWKYHNHLDPALTGTVTVQ